MPTVLTAGMKVDMDIEIRRLGMLVHDLIRIRDGDGDGPTAGELRGAPLLAGWQGALRTVACLRGHAIGHPRLARERVTVTSPIWVLDVDRGYARTESRFYRLGNPGMVERDA